MRSSIASIENWTRCWTMPDSRAVSAESAVMTESAELKSPDSQERLEFECCLAP